MKSKLLVLFMVAYSLLGAVENILAGDIFGESTRSTRLRCNDALVSIEPSDPRVGPISSELTPSNLLDLHKRLIRYFDHNIKTSRFAVHRGLFDHLLSMKTQSFPYYEIPYSFAQSMAQLNSHSHVLDLGAGVFVFIDDMLHDPIKIVNWTYEKYGVGNIGDGPALVKAIKEKGVPNFTGVTMSDFSQKYNGPLREPMNIPSILDLKANPKINALIGRYFEEIPNEDLVGKFGKVDFLVDSHGVLAYTLNMGLTLTKLSEIMKPGGELWMNTVRQTIKLEDGTDLKLEEFMVSTGLFEFVGKSPSTFTEGAHLRRTATPPRAIRLELLQFHVSDKGDTPIVEWRYRGLAPAEKFRL